MPVPDSGAVVGLSLALLLMLTAPVRVPVALWVNRTVTVHDAPTARLAQVLLSAKSPLAETADTVAVVVPVLVTVTVCAADEFPTRVPAKARPAGFKLSMGPGATPVPDSGTVSVMP